MLRVVFALIILLVVAPVAGAKSFEMETASGDFSYRGVARFDSLVVIESISVGARVSGPLALATSIRCVDGRQLQTCIKIVRVKTPVEIRVTKPIMLSLHQRGAFTLMITRAEQFEHVWISGYGQVGLHGHGVYSADERPKITYVAADGPRSLRLK